MPESDHPHALRVTATNEHGQVVDSRGPKLRHGHATTALTDLDPGAYTINITSKGGDLTRIPTAVLIWPPESGTTP